MLHTVARFTPVEWVLLDACDLAGNPTEVVSGWCWWLRWSWWYLWSWWSRQDEVLLKIVGGILSCFSLLVVHHNNHHGVVSFATIWIFLASVGDKSQQRKMYSEKKYNGQKQTSHFSSTFPIESSRMWNSKTQNTKIFTNIISGITRCRNEQFWKLT